MRAAAIAGLTLALLSSTASPARAAPDDPAAVRAEALFREAAALRDANRFAEACPKFAESRALAPAIGVTLHLADCYEHLGKTASAWSTFREAERMASSRRDRRAAVAHERAHALEPKLAFAYAEVPPTLVDLANVSLDGEQLSPSRWQSGVAVDPGDHVVAIEVPGLPPQTVVIHAVESGAAHARFRVPDEAPSPPPIAAPTASPPPLPATLPATAKIAAPPVERRTSGARGPITIGLVGASVVCVGVGAAFLAVRNESKTGGSATEPPHEDRAAATVSATAFALGGAAIASAVVLYLTAPRADGTAITIAPTPLIGGGGALLRSTF